MRRNVSVLIGGLLIASALLGSRPAAQAGPQGAFRLFLPMLAGGAVPVRGTAGCGGLGEWCFNYYPPDTVDDSQPREVVPLVSSRLMAMAGNPPLKLGASQRISLFNEPDNADMQHGDNLTPQQAAPLFWQYANQMPDDAKIICCNDYYSPQWMDSFLAVCNCLNRLTGIGFHVYAELWIAPNATEAQKLANWQAQVQTWLNWTKAHNGPYPTRQLESWLTETGFSPCCEPDESTALRHLQMICAALKQTHPDRFAWFNGGNDVQFGTQHIALNSADGTINTLGRAWGTC